MNLLYIILYLKPCCVCSTTLFLFHSSGVARPAARKDALTFTIKGHNQRPDILNAEATRSRRMLFRLPLLRRQSVEFLFLLHSFRSIRSVASFTAYPSLSSSSSFGSITRPFVSHKMTASCTKTIKGGEDPYTFLEEVESEESINFAKQANEKCLSQLGDPSDTETYKRVLAALESDDRIPHARLLGYEDGTGDMLLYNFWRDSKV